MEGNCNCEDSMYGTHRDIVGAVDKTWELDLNSYFTIYIYLFYLLLYNATYSDSKMSITTYTMLTS